MKGEKVTVLRMVEAGRDPGNNVIYEELAEDVDDVLVAPGPRNDLTESNRPSGTRVAWNLHFPKTFSGSLRGAKISVRGGEARKVIGDPQPYTAANTPTRWNMPVELEGTDG